MEDSHLPDTVAYRPRVTQVSLRSGSQSCVDQDYGCPVPQALQPSRERAALDHTDHTPIVNHSSQHSNASRRRTMTKQKTAKLESD